MKKRDNLSTHQSDDKFMVREQPFTYDEYAQMPDDGNRYEIASGVLELMSPAPTPKHQVISNQMQTILTNSCQMEYIVFASPIDLILSATEVRQPDLLMVHRNRMEIITRRGIEGIPDLVGEILSPHSAKRDKVQKLAAYAAYRIPEYWIVDSANELLEQYLLANDKYELHNLYSCEEQVQSDRLPCVSFTMGQIVAAAEGLPG
ncbi:Uma2 family endonuclease [Paenibacillus sp. J5C_2022]|uniref:Uma2 family endonuclease n=1 Tax=Paenibacillus sp. J5C2022 TaxID=2977129 RepID=UPI0021D12C7E|nr:Uma2 family endonuclease [Paenibacillus sp. J5C2022]MCU6711377.1 Uma2 family endonuclease [Paenibacillus sp. J5C2022]